MVSWMEERLGTMPQITESSNGTYYLGIDPGSSSGGACLLDSSGNLLSEIAFNKPTEHVIAGWFASISDHNNIRAALEKVHSIPKQSAQSGFKFGWSYGFLRGLLVAYQIPFIEPSPQRWQKDMGLIVKGRKDIRDKQYEKKKMHLAKAHERWPKYAKQITHSTADAILIAEWLRKGDK